MDLYNFENTAQPERTPRDVFYSWAKRAYFSQINSIKVTVQIKCIEENWDDAYRPWWTPEIMLSV